MPFRFSGSKRRLLRYLPGPPLSARTTVEPFAGSLAYSLHWRRERVFAAEANPLVRGLWEWLRTEATDARLHFLETLRPKVKVDAREHGAAHGLCEAEVTLLRLQVSGAYVGQLSSWCLWPQHTLDLGAIREALPYIRAAVQPLATDYRDVAEAAAPGAVVLVDPPYIGTSGNYKARGRDYGSVDPAEVTAFIQGLRCPVAFTYGDGAAETFPEFTWRKLVTRKVPVLRGGGTRERGEWLALVNWPGGGA